MSEKYSDLTEKAAWEIFVQLVGHGVDSHLAATKAFTALEHFDHQCAERQEKQRETMPITKID